MGAISNIAWTDASFNPWWGCEEIGDGCTNCYARTWAARSGYPDAWNGKYRFFGDKHWNEPVKWNRKAEKENRRIKVFCASMADVFDIKVPGGDELRARLFKLIKDTPNLDWQLLTKRIGNVKRMLPKDWRDGYENVWLGITVVNQEEADRDVPKLLQTCARIRWLSVEPMLASIDMRDWLVQTCCRYNRGKKDDGSDGCDGPGCNGTRINWVVVGGESGAKARPMEIDWARSVRDQCNVWRTPYFFKQWGNFAPRGNFGPPLLVDIDMSEYDPDEMIRVGVKQAGSKLDGKYHQEFPT